jgi:hypothetical protein
MNIPLILDFVKLHLGSDYYSIQAKRLTRRNDSLHCISKFITSIDDEDKVFD